MDGASSQSSPFHSSSLKPGGISIWGRRLRMFALEADDMFNWSKNLRQGPATRCRGLPRSIHPIIPIKAQIQDMPASPATYTKKAIDLS